MVTHRYLPIVEHTCCQSDFLPTDEPLRCLEWVTIFPTFSTTWYTGFIVLTHHIVPRQYVQLAPRYRQTKDWISDWWERWTLHSRVWSPTANSWHSLRAQLVSATYFVHRRGLPWYKVLQNFLFLYKNKHFCRNPAFLNNNWYRVTIATAWKDGHEEGLWQYTLLVEALNREW